MRAELRDAKTFGRHNSCLIRCNVEKYKEWVNQKHIRLIPGWVHQMGRNRSCLYISLAGYVKRKRQIFNCFMKGWC